MEKNLKKDYENAVDAYLKAFCEMYELQYDEDCWVGREVGTIAEVGDYFFGFDDIKRCVDDGYEWDEVIAWYDYGVEAGMFGIDAPNLKSWMAGCPHLNGPEMERIRAARRRVDEAKAALEAEIEELTKGHKKTAHKPWECCF